MAHPVGPFDFFIYAFIKTKMDSLGVAEVWWGGSDEDNEGNKFYKVCILDYLAVNC